MNVFSSSNIVNLLLRINVREGGRWTNFFYEFRSVLIFGALIVVAWGRLGPPILCYWFYSKIGNTA